MQGFTVSIQKPVEKLTIQDLKTHPIWEYVNDHRFGDTVVRPIKRLPVTTFAGRVVGSRVTLAQGEFVWALIGNVSVTDSSFTQHFLTLSIRHKNRWFTLARYHDVEWGRRGPTALAQLLGKNVKDVFPIKYDLSEFLQAPSGALTGEILEDPVERLSRKELIKWAVRAPD